MEKTICFVFLTVCGIWDAKRKSLPVWVLLAGTCVAAGILAVRCVSNGFGVLVSPAIGVLLGLGLLLASILIPGSVGSGDAWLMVNTGLFLGWEENLVLLWISSVLALLFSGVLLLLGKGNRKTRIPMAPFVWLAFCLLEFFRQGSGL